MSLRIIIADDHQVARIGMKVVIESHAAGWVVAQANGPEELLNALSQTPCDALVTDLNMPHPTQPDGVAMLQRIHALYPNLPIVVLTMSQNLGLLRRAYAAGARGVLDKASSLNELPDAIHTVCRQLQSYIGWDIQRRCERLGVPTPITAPIKPLSGAERYVLRLLADGLSLAQIARRTQRKPNTVSRQKIEAMKKLGAANDMELMELLRTDAWH
jgi:two-component system capsular synthesis response regulator RcsB